MSPAEARELVQRYITSDNATTRLRDLVTDLVAEVGSFTHMGRAFALQESGDLFCVPICSLTEAVALGPTPPVAEAVTAIGGEA